MLIIYDHKVELHGMRGFSCIILVFSIITVRSNGLHVMSDTYVYRSYQQLREGLVVNEYVKLER